MWNGYLIKIIAGTEVEINDKKFKLNPRIQKVITETSNIPLKNLKDKGGEFFINILGSLVFENCKAIRSESKSGRYKQSKSNFRKRILEGQGLKMIILSSIIDIYNRLEKFFGVKLSGTYSYRSIKPK